MDDRPVGRDAEGRPDPSSLTTAALIREIESLKELIFTRLDASDKAVKVFSDNLQRVPTDVTQQVTGLRELLTERFAGFEQRFATVDQRFDTVDVEFKSIEKQFVERDVRTEQTARDAKTAVDAALQAQKEAAGAQAQTFKEATAKTEAAFTKLLDQQSLLIEKGTRSLEDKIADLKERFYRGEGVIAGTAGAATTHQAGANYTLAVVGFLVSSGIAIVAILLAVMK